MKTKAITVTLATLLLMACAEPKKEQSTDNMPAEQNDAARETPTEPIVAIPEDDTDTISNERERFKAEINRKIDRNRLDIEELRTELRDVKNTARKDTEDQISKLEQKNNALRTRLDNMQDVSADKWSQFKSDFNRDADELGNDIAKLFKKKK
jgi:TolA-binding protein